MARTQRNCHLAPKPLCTTPRSLSSVTTSQGLLLCNKLVPLRKCLLAAAPAKPLSAATPIRPLQAVLPSSGAGAVTAAPSPTSPSPLPQQPWQVANRASGTQPSLVRTQTVAAPEPELSPQPSSFSWARNWVPVAPLSYLDTIRPTGLMLLGQQLVVWRHTTHGWVVQRDVCPHRLAPLSEGRLEAGGSRLACAYHGWEFDEEGRCTRVPQLLADPRAAANACASPRSCVTSYPTLELDGLLFVWLDASKEGRAAAQGAPKPTLMDELAPMATDWFMNEMPSDYTFWLEQSMDPTHASFLHRSLGLFGAATSIPMESKPVEHVNLLAGFRWEHGAYQASQAGMKALREFVPPFITKVRYYLARGGLTLFFWTMAVPVRLGVARVYFKAGFARAHETAAAEPLQQQQQQDEGEGAGSIDAVTKANGAPAEGPQQAAPLVPGGPRKKGRVGGTLSASWLRRLSVWMPHWLLAGQLIADQDLILIIRQETLMRRESLTARDYNLNSKGDAGVAAINVWLRKAGYPHSLWGQGLAPQTGPTYGNWPGKELPLEQLLSRQDRHVRHCVVCQRGLMLVTAVCTALTAASGLAAVAAVTLAIMIATSASGATAVGSWGPLGVAGVIAVVLGAAAVQGWSFREERFVSGAAQWRHIGGLSLVGSKYK